MRVLLLLVLPLALVACTGDVEGGDGASGEADTLGTAEEVEAEAGNGGVGEPAFVLDGDTLAPRAFEALMPSLESGQPRATAVALDTVSAGGEKIEDGWFNVDRGEGLGFVGYRYLGQRGGRHAFVVRENGGGTLSQAGVFVLTFEGGTAASQGFAYVENLRDHPVRLAGDSLYYDGAAVALRDFPPGE